MALYIEINTHSNQERVVSNTGSYIRLKRARGAQTFTISRTMHACLALAALVFVARATASPRDRIGYEREIDSTDYNQVPKMAGYVLSDGLLTQQKNRGKLVTKLRADEAVAADGLILESNVVHIVKPARRKQETAQVRRRRGYNLENVWVPARYPYLPVPHYSRYRRRGYQDLVDVYYLYVHCTVAVNEGSVAAGSVDRVIGFKLK